MDDLGPNKQRLFSIAEMALGGETLVDLGVRSGNSSFTMLDATKPQGSFVFGVDPAPCPFICPDRYEYFQTDSITAASIIPKEIYLCFFDTLHIKEQVMAELHYYWPKIRVGGWAVFHDTVWPEWKHDEYLGTVWGQAVEGVNAFFKDAHGHIDREDFPESYGMTFIRKKSLWNPTVPGMEEALAASKMLTEALCK